MKTMNPQSTNQSITSDMFKSFAGVVREQPLVAGTMWVGVFSLLLSFSLMLGIVPTIEADAEEAPEPEVTVADSTTPDVEVDSTPVRIIADAIDLDATIVAPESRDIAELDNALLSGVVHYPGSANLGEDGNVFLFGHSTGFRVVQNNAFKVFNELKNLKEHDLIRVQSGTHEYVYRVMTVSLVDADKAFVDLSRTGRRLTLSTCNSFGAQQERFVVDAEFVGAYPL